MTKALGLAFTQRQNTMEGTIFDGWTGHLMELQNETMQLLHKVRPKRKGSHQHTIGKGWAVLTNNKQHQQSTERVMSGTRQGSKGSKGGRKRQLATTGTTMLPQSPHRGSSDTAASAGPGVAPTPSPVDGSVFTWANADNQAMPSGTQDKTQAARYAAEVMEEPRRTLDFDAERQRVSESTDVFVPNESMRLLDLERERRRLDRLALKRDEVKAQREKQRKEITARREWLKRDVAALKIQSLFRGHIGRRRIEVMKTMMEIERGAEKDWVEVRDQESGERWFYNPVTGKSRWEPPPSLIGLNPPEERVHILPPVKPLTPELKETPPVAHGMEGKAPSTLDKPGTADTVLPPLSSGSPARPDTAVLWDSGEEAPEVDEEKEEAAEGGLFSNLKDRFFTMDGRANVTLRTTVKHVLKQSKWDSVSTLLTNLAVEDADGNDTQSEAQGHEEGPEVAGQVVRRKPLFGDRDMPRPMVALYKHKQVRDLTDLKGAQQAMTPPRSGAHRGGNKRTRTQEGMDPLGLNIRDHTPGFEAPLSPEKQSSERAATAVSLTGETQDVKETDTKLITEVCFNCWSAGRGKKCTLHNVDEGGNPVKNTESRLTCKNWDIGVMRRRYRAEEIQEIFAKSASSLRYDRQRKIFVTVVEQRHTIYRSLNSLIAKHNLRMRSMLHGRMWMVSFAEYLRRKNTGNTGHLQNKDRSKFYRATVSMRNFFDIRRYRRKVNDLIPVPPITGRTLAELVGEVQYIFEETHEESGELVRYIISPPTPVPIKLYDARVYELPVPRSIELPEHSSEAATAAATVPPPNVHISAKSRVAWVETFAASLARDCLQTARANIKKLIPDTEVAKLQRQKYPPPVTVRFARFSRKPTEKMMAVGGLSAELLISQLVQTTIAAQYGNLMAMETASIAPGVTPETSITFRSLEVPFLVAGFDERPLQHLLNARRAPGLALMTSIKKSNRHAHGPNRLEQTGEKLDLGFRTSEYAPGLPIVSTVDPWAFTPTAEVATLNKAKSNASVTSHADLNYPFCEPSSRPSTTMDYYHLLLTGVCTRNKPQVFTAIGMQLPGNYLKHGDKNSPLGSIVTAVYRSWAFMQKSHVEEFVTDDGVPYWYDRRDGVTYWERPLTEIEQLPVKQGGTTIQLTGEEPEKDSKYANSGAYRYGTDDIRRIMLRKHEDPQEVMQRRTNVAASARAAISLRDAHDTTGLLHTTMLDDEGEDEDGEEREEGVVGDTLVGFGGMMGRSGLAATAGLPASIDISMRPSTAAGTEQRQSQTPRKTAVPGCPGGNRASVMGATQGGRGQQEKASASALPVMKKADEVMVSRITDAIAQALPAMQMQAQSPEDLIRLGLGLGMSLQAAGVLEEIKKTATEEAAKMEGQPSEPGIPMVSKEWLASREVSKTQKHPVGVPDTDPNVRKEIIALDHSSEVEQRQRLLSNKPLTLLQQVKGMRVVPTPTPDEQPKEAAQHSPLMVNIDQINSSIPVLARPESLLRKQYLTHHAAGLGSSFTMDENKDQKNMSKGQLAALRSLRDPIPSDFLSAIHERHVAKQYVDYLPQVPNLPQLTCIGAVKPRSAAEDWLAIGFDPWSAGKDPLVSEHVKVLGLGMDPLQLEAEKQALGDMGRDDAFIETVDREGMKRQAEVAAELKKLDEDFQQITSYIRHGKYREIEEDICQVDWALPMDHTDEHGNTMLHVAVQNGSKRIAKLLLRRGADINKQNLNGETVLHFAYAYGFDDLGDYLRSKGADDTMRNIDGLTCYEGLHNDDVEGL